MEEMDSVQPEVEVEELEEMADSFIWFTNKLHKMEHYPLQVVMVELVEPEMVELIMDQMEAQDQVEWL